MDADNSLDNGFFPDSGVVSVMAVYSDGGTIEMATIGREGCTAVQAVLGAKSSSARFFAQQGCLMRLSQGLWDRCRPSDVLCTLTSMPFLSRLWYRQRAMGPMASRS